MGRKKKKKPFVIRPWTFSLMHPDLPLPKRNMPFLTNHCRKVYRDNFADLPPTYVAYHKVVEGWYKSHHPKFRWGPPLPQSQWLDAENKWRRKYIAPVAMAAIEADHSFYQRDYIPQSPLGRDKNPGMSSFRCGDYLGDDWVAGYDF